MASRINHMASGHIQGIALSISRVSGSTWMKSVFTSRPQFHGDGLSAAHGPTRVVIHMIYIYIYIYIYTYVYIYIYICIYIYIHMCIYMYIYIYTCMYIYMCVYVYVNVNVDVIISYVKLCYIYTYMDISVCTIYEIYSWYSTKLYTCIHNYRSTYIYTHLLNHPFWVGNMFDPYPYGSYWLI